MRESGVGEKEGAKGSGDRERRKRKERKKDTHMDAQIYRDIHVDTRKDREREE